eukprot:TRINITY_DN8034_c0_g2_i1.p1 TRINITY_DN8034_c0_g2~~TRINITY_DN8034_c0_g2_i1.p1  ORF type:complete len:1350 (+),score=467.78 TRINITY_DN8034_c0_g2_i1:135-4184(+)
MGNQLALGADVNVADVLEGRLRGKGQLGGGKGRLLKTVHCGHDDGDVVAKFFLKTSPQDEETVDQEQKKLVAYGERLAQLRRTRPGPTNVCWYSQFRNIRQTKTSNAAAFLIRTYFRHSLQERVMTRPFVPKVGRLWMAYQLLCAVDEMHSAQISHGDIKAENVMVTAMGWVYVVDLAPFKPTYIPEENPSDFSYFFDTAENRHCTLAPERFVPRDARVDRPQGQAARRRAVQDWVDDEDRVTEQMDVFSAACTIAQLFRDGEVLFKLDQLRAYKAGTYDPRPGLSEKVRDEAVVAMIMAPLERDPQRRPSAREVITRFTPSVFPRYFGAFHELVIGPLSELSPDKRVEALNARIDELLAYLRGTECEENIQGAAVLLANVLAASVRHCGLTANKVHCLQLMARVAEHAGDDCCLRLLLPYAVTQLQRDRPLVRATAVRAIAAIVGQVREFAPGEARLFEEYLVPAIMPLANDESPHVRATLAEMLPEIAAHARRFVEARQLLPQLADAALVSSSQSGYDSDLGQLHEMFKHLVAELVHRADVDAFVARGFLSDLEKLCVFFGRHMTDRFILPSLAMGHFLSAPDFQVRRELHAKLLGVALYVGPGSLEWILTLLKEGLLDAEEVVVSEALGSLEQLAALGLLERAELTALAAQIAPQLMHPSRWIRDGALGFFSALPKCLSEVDVLCFVLPLAEPFLQYRVLSLERETLSAALLPPIPRQAFAEALRSGRLDHAQLPQGSIGCEAESRRREQLDAFVTTAMQALRRGHVADIAAGVAGNSPDAQDTGGPDLEVAPRELKEHARSWPQLEQDARLLQALDPPPGDAAGVLNNLEFQLTEVEQPDPGAELGAASTGEALRCPNLGCARPTGRQLRRMRLKQEEARRQEPIPRGDGSSQARQRDRDRGATQSPRGGQRGDDPAGGYGMLRDARPTSALICQAEEHQAAVTDLAVHDTLPVFLTASMDASVRLWDARKVDREAALVSQMTYIDASTEGQDSPVLSVAMLRGQPDETGCCGNAAGTLAMFCIESGVFLHRQSLAGGEGGGVSALRRAGSSDVIVAATHGGFLCAADGRAHREVFSVRAERAHGPMTGLVVGDEHGRGSWVVTTTSRGFVSLWDLRFRMPVRTWDIGEPANVVAVNGGDPVVLIGASQIQRWSLEKLSLVATYRPSSCTGPPAAALPRGGEHHLTRVAGQLSECGGAGGAAPQRHSIRAICGSREASWFITGGTDRCIRYWDAEKPRAGSYVVSGLRPGEPPLRYEVSTAAGQVSQIVEVADAGSHAAGRPDPAAGGLRAASQAHQQHKDAVTALALLRPSRDLSAQPLLVSASRDGCVKMWQNASPPAVGDKK